MATKKTPPHVAQQRLSKAAVKHVVAAKQQRAAFFDKVRATTAEAVRSPRKADSQVVDRTKATKSAPWLDQYRRTTEPKATR